MAVQVAGDLVSPQRGRPPLDGVVVATPPKTPARSPRGRVDAGGDRGGAGDTAQAGVVVPFAVCEAVTRAIWSHAKMQAELSVVQDRGDAPAPLQQQDNTQQRGRSPSCSSNKRPRRGACGSASHHEEAAIAIFAKCRPSQPSQSQEEHKPLSASSEEGVASARGALTVALAQLGRGGDAAVAPELDARVRAMALCAMAYWREVSLDLSKAASLLYRFLEHQRPLYWQRPPWRGVNLGGWLLLEPGPSAELFSRFDGVRCEWDLIRSMRETYGREKAAEMLEAHRETFIVEEDIRHIQGMGLNAVRIPFGYWVVAGPAPEDEFVGPCLQYLDRVLAWCERYDLQVLLDLHGAPGGESGEKPCGRERKDWNWNHWRFDDSISALRLVAERYRGHRCVTGVAVCNEPSETIPAEVLCQFYDRAIRTIREAGMRPDEVSVVLPVYRTERLDEIWRIWNRQYDGFVRHTNVAFDLHLYHVFGPWWQRQGLGNHLRMAKRHRKILRRVPAVVGEWSLALPPRIVGDCDNPQDVDHVERQFAGAQLEAYGQASHGWFFWNWRDCPRQHAGWDLQRCFERQWLSKALLTDAAGSSAK